jgi:hypothetical protein
VKFVHVFFAVPRFLRLTSSRSARKKRKNTILKPILVRTAPRAVRPRGRWTADGHGTVYEFLTVFHFFFFFFFCLFIFSRNRRTGYGIISCPTTKLRTVPCGAQRNCATDRPTPQTQLAHVRNCVSGDRVDQEWPVKSDTRRTCLPVSKTTIVIVQSPYAPVQPTPAAFVYPGIRYTPLRCKVPRVHIYCIMYYYHRRYGRIMYRTIVSLSLSCGS